MMKAKLSVSTVNCANASLTTQMPRKLTWQDADIDSSSRWVCIFDAEIVKLFPHVVSGNRTNAPSVVPSWTTACDMETLFLVIILKQKANPQALLFGETSHLPLSELKQNLIQNSLKAKVPKMGLTQGPRDSCQKS